MVNDPIGDMLIQIKNAAAAGRKTVELPCSRMKLSVAKILATEQYIESVEKTGTEPKMNLKIVLRYNGTESAILGVKRISKPGLRWYVDKRSIPKVVGGMGISILSTSRGIMTDKQARKQGVGGELLCEIW